jgi:hypothetical protein
MNMIPYWTFGVELEFIFAETIIDQPNPDPSATRFTQFQDLDSAYPHRLEDMRFSRNKSPEHLARITNLVINHIQGTLTATGFKCTTGDEPDISTWRVTRDSSIEPPTDVENWNPGYV